MAKLTKLKKLTIFRGEIDTLECFAASPISQSLEELTLQSHHFPPSELSNLYGLHRLQSLRLMCCFSPCLDAATIARMSPPTPVLPALTFLIIQWRNADDGWEEVERRGASYEWMQQRLTQ